MGSKGLFASSMCAAAAKELEINPSTLYRKAKSLNIELPKAAGRDKSD